MRKPMVWVVVVLTLAMIIVGFLLKGPQPEISLKAEEIFSIGGFKVTNTMMTAYIVSGLLVLGSWLATRKAAVVPSGFYNFVEAIIAWLLQMTEDIAGPKNARRFFPVCATIFLFVISCNYFGLLPIVNSIGVAHRTANQETGFVFKGNDSIRVVMPNGGQVKEGETASKLKDDEGLATFRPYLRSVNSDANSPLSIAIWSFLFVEFWGISTLGIKYFGKFLAFPPFAKFNGIGLFVGILELLSEFIRIISFTFRLFGNIFAGDVLIVFISFLAPFIFPVVFYGLETFVGFIQASVFALLTLVFAVMAVEHHGEEEHEAHGTPGEHVEAAAH